MNEVTDRLQNGVYGFVLMLVWVIFPSETRADELAGFDCLIEPHAVMDISTREEGVLEEILATRGDIVKKGQVLARLESGLEELTVQLAQARSKMRSDMESKKSALRYHRRQYKRVSDLYVSKAIPFHEKDKAETDVILAEMSLREAEDSLQLLQIEYQRANYLLEKRTIRSPVDGVMVRNLLQVGESVEDRPIMTLAQVDPLNVEVIISVEMFGLVAVGDKAEVTPRIREGKVRQASVTIVDRVIDAASDTFGVRLELPNKGYDIPGGIRCDIRFLDSGR